MPQTANLAPTGGYRLWKYSLGFVLLLAMLFCAYHTLRISAGLHTWKADYAELHSVRYELMNTRIWAQKLGEVLDRKIDEFELTDHNRVQIQRSVEKILDQLIVEVDRIVRERNLSEHSALGILRQLLTDFIVDIDSLRERTPELAEIIMDEIDSSDGRSRIKGALRMYLDELVADSMTPVDMAPYEALLERYDCADRQACTSVLREGMERQSGVLDRYAWGVLGLGFTLFLLLVWRGLPLSSGGLLLLVFSGTTLLVLGITLPMIEIEAKIQALQVFVLGEPLSFTDQILFFQRKSITDVVEVLVATGEAKMILVGVLLTMFSIIFPIMKLLATYVYFYDFRRLSAHGAVRFFAFRSGKWSMADVMVVAMFMAYLGFEGIIDNQMEELHSLSQYLNVLTTNGTQLEAGFFLFLGFVLFSLSLANIVDKTE